VVINFKQSTYHIIKQVEWYHILKDVCKCVKAECEYKFLNYIIDVYGETRKGHKFFVEIGDIKNKDKAKFLDQLGKEEDVDYFYVPYPQVRRRHSWY
jgi:hypothetical protein